MNTKQEPYEITITKIAPAEISEGGVVKFSACPSENTNKLKENGISIKWDCFGEGSFVKDKNKDPLNKSWDTTGLSSSSYSIRVQLVKGKDVLASDDKDVTVTPRLISRDPIQPVISIRSASTPFTEDLLLWIVIREGTEAMSFDNYNLFMEHVFCGKPIKDNQNHEAFDDLRIDLQKKRCLPFNNIDAYQLLKTATEAFVIVNCAIDLNGFAFDKLHDEYNNKFRGANIDSIDNNQFKVLWLKYLEDVNGTPDSTLPYLDYIRKKMPELQIKNMDLHLRKEEDGYDKNCFGILRSKLTQPCFLELIWSYWHEEGMLVQAMNAISRRFQNMSSSSGKDPLVNLHTNPLRPLNNLLWGYIQDEQHRLTVQRRAYEYDHHYGLRIVGKAVPHMRPADSRSKFLEAFHNLLHLCTIFYREEDNNNVNADAFPILNSFKEVQLILNQGQHNQFGDLPSTGRMEMLMQQWLLARPEFREFLPSRASVPYTEPWMGALDTMKNLMSWSDVSSSTYHNLGDYGEKLLLTIRYGTIGIEPHQAANWAKFWRPVIQGYIHSYREVTGVDLKVEPVDATLPSVHMSKRLAGQKQKVA